jgi:hypothetical protein
MRVHSGKKRIRLLLRRRTIPPQLVISLSNQDATRDTYQRKVFFDGHNFFVAFFSSSPTPGVFITISSDGVKWTTPASLVSGTPYAGGGNVDLNYPNKGFKDLIGRSFSFTLVVEISGNWFVYPYKITGQSADGHLSGSALSGAGNYQGGTLAASLDGADEIWVIHNGSYIFAGHWATTRAQDNSVSFGGTTTGGCQILTYQTIALGNFFVLAKDASNVLHYSRASPGGVSFLDAFPSIATLTTSFSDFCGCTEAQALGTPARVHMVYIKSTGDLCYRNYQGDALSAETLLVPAANSPSYPAIAADRYGSLYVFFVQAGQIMLMMFTSGAWRTPTVFFTSHSYNTPVYLSTGQYAQNGHVCLVWMEGSASPYQLWFAAIPEGY